ncbi:gamma-mobile-trio protein GmtX [Roseateles sp. DC23W]|uniref:Gamma-mobile-trio protein GmtX n=1 Tax=Pelomonas dachongensis TaxID=3299029 RepID=A0ABW7EJI5_9BURK
MSAANEPDTVFQELLAANPRPQKVRNLNALHELCRDHHATGGRDFTLPTIGKFCQDKGIFAKGRALYNEPAADYRKLIEAWARLAGPAPVKVRKELSTDEYVSRIPDPAIRMLVQSTIAERNKLKSQLNMLRSTKVLEVDRRPVVDVQPLIGNPAAGLTASEKEALAKAVSKKFLDRKGWEEIALGEIVDESGRTLFDPGFGTGLRKLLGAI